MKALSTVVLAALLVVMPGCLTTQPQTVQDTLPLFEAAAYTGTVLRLDKKPEDRQTFEQVREFDFTRQLVLMEEAVKSVTEMVQAFRQGAGIAEIKRLDARVQRLENEADDVVLHLIRRLLDPASPTLQGIILKDLIELNEKVVDRCRDASSVIARVMLKIS